MLDIGTFSKRTLLTGAGWTRNWGGRLASEVWQDLIGNRSVQNNSGLRELLLREQSFEEVLGLTLQMPFTRSDREILQRAVFDVFSAMDREIARHDNEPRINIYKVQELLFQFWRGHALRVDAGYVFTLNQDLWLERNFFNEHVHGAPVPSLPGLQGRPNQRFFSSVMDVASQDTSMRPVNNSCCDPIAREF